MEQKETNFIYEWNIIEGLSDQPHSRVREQWHSVQWWLSVSDLFIYSHQYVCYALCSHEFHLAEKRVNGVAARATIYHILIIVYTCECGLARIMFMLRVLVYVQGLKILNKSVEQQPFPN